MPEFDAPQDVVARSAPGVPDDGFERKASELETRLRRSQRLVDVAQELGNVGFFQYHFGSRDLDCSPGQWRLFGYVDGPPTPAMQMWEARVDADDRGRVVTEIRAMLAAGLRAGSMRFALRLPDGTERWLEARMVIEYDGTGQPLRVIGLSFDVSEQRAVEAERTRVIEAEKRARHEAQVASHAKDEFLAMLGHELRNPLNAIATAIEVLNRTEADAAVAISARKIIGNQTRQLARMLDRLLDVGHVLTDDVVLLRQPVNLAAIAQRAATMAQADAASKSQTVQLRVVDAWIDGDSDRLQQVMEQLLSNAVKFTPTGGRIDIDLTLRDSVAVLSVTDTSGGIDLALIDRIFEPFVQGERGLARQDGGLGIGLALVRRLVELHGGEVAVRSSADGSVFEVRLPTIAPPTAQLRQSKRVLIVEDNIDALSSLRSMLELENHRVQSAIDGPDGLGKLLAGSFEIAILDIGLPGIDGYEIARRSRAAGFAGLLIALTGYAQGRDAQMAIDAGFDAHLSKPADIDTLLALIQSRPQAGRGRVAG